MHIGKRIQALRTRKGWRLTELARQAQIDHGWLSRLEDGSRDGLSLKAAVRLARALGVTLDGLVGEPGHAEHNPRAPTGEQPQRAPATPDDPPRRRRAPRAMG